MILTKKHLPRRTFLKGVGATIALPMLDAMSPALSALSATTRSAAPSPLRLAFTYVPNGTQGFRVEVVDTDNRAFKGEWPFQASEM